MKLNNEQSLKSGIYKIINTLSGKFYYGSAKCFKKRWYEHERTLRNKTHDNSKLQRDFNKWLKKQKDENDDFLLFEIVEIMEGSTKEEREIIEKRYIDENYGDGTLCCNIQRETIRPQGPWSSTPEETRKKLSEASKGKNNPMFGKSGALSPLYGKHHAEETKRKISDAQKGKIISVEQRQKISETNKRLGIKPPSQKGKKASEETKRKMSVAHKGSKRTPEQCKRVSKAKKGKKLSKEHRKKLVEAWKNRSPISEKARKRMGEAQRKRRIKEGAKKIK